MPIWVPVLAFSMLKVGFFNKKTCIECGTITNNWTRVESDGETWFYCDGCFKFPRFESP